jgi:hypothetical protein
MFNNNSIPALLLVFLCVFGSMAQTYSDDRDDTSGQDIVIEGNEISEQVLSNLGIFTGVNPRSASLTGRQVFLRQIGDLNAVAINVTADASEINVLQEGDQNQTSLTYLARTVITDIKQLGSFNNILDYAIAPDIDLSLDLVQEGDYLNFRREGINELTKSLKFRQTEGTPTLIIRSFN